MIFRRPSIPIISLSYYILHRKHMNIHSHTNHFSYRPDIDGLRAIAVIAVILFHINTNWLPGGFLGVDIFFVISGYLITSIIHRELSKQHFSLLNFYQRRAKRILPAFLFMLITCTAVSAWLMLPEDFTSYLGSLHYSLFFAANLYFAKYGGYFDIASTEKPLLHIWSLSLEEQFYFIFPFLMWFIYKYLAKYALQAITSLIIISLSCSLISYQIDAYYLPHVRAYELLIGSFAAIWNSRQSIHSVLHKYSYYVTTFAVILIMVCLSLPDGKEHFERHFAICCASAWLIVGNKNNFLQRFLALRPIVWIGLISYPLYLWHWPILALLRYANMSASLHTSIIAFVIPLTILISLVSYKWVEMPIRYHSTLSPHVFSAVMALYFLLAITIGFIFYQQNTHQHLPKQNSEWHTNICNDGERHNCIKGDRTKPVSVLAIGDSHTAHYNSFYDIIGKHEGWAAYVVSVSGCGFYLGDRYSYPPTKSEDYCQKMRWEAKQNLKQYQTIIISQRWQQQLLTNKFRFEEDFNRTLRLLSEAGKNIYIIKDNPPSSGQNTKRGEHLRNLGISFPLTEAQQKLQEYEAANSEIRRLAAKYPKTYWVDFTDLIPADFSINDSRIYIDQDHINVYGSQLLAERFIANGRLLILDSKQNIPTTIQRENGRTYIQERKQQ